MHFFLKPRPFKFFCKQCSGALAFQAFNPSKRTVHPGNIPLLLVKRLESWRYSAHEKYSHCQQIRKTMYLNSLGLSIIFFQKEPSEHSVCSV